MEVEYEKSRRGKRNVWNNIICKNIIYSNVRTCLFSLVSGIPAQIVYSATGGM